MANYSTGSGVPDPEMEDDAEVGMGTDSGGTEINDQPGGEEGSGGGKTFFLPPEFIDSYDCQPGDSITLEVVNIDKDGDKEVRVKNVSHKGEGGSGLIDELRASKDKLMND